MVNDIFWFLLRNIVVKEYDNLSVTVFKKEVA